MLTTVLLSVFIDVFYKDISRRFSFSYARFLNEGVLAFSSQSDCTLFCSTFNLASVLKGMSLSAKVTVIVRGGYPIPCGGKMLSVDDSGQIHFFGLD